jgi:type II secretory pathway pseudopilin PulG
MKIYEHPRPSGFALLENMIAILLLAVGAIGIALSTATAIKINVDNQQRAMALNAAGTALDALYYAAKVTDGGAVLQSAIAPFAATSEEDEEPEGYAVCVNQIDPDEDACNHDNYRDVYLVKVLRAVDGAGADVLATAAPYVSPVTIAVEVDYEGTAGSNVDGVEQVKSVRTSYTFVLES